MERESGMLLSNTLLKIYTKNFVYIICFIFHI